MLHPSEPPILARARRLIPPKTGIIVVMLVLIFGGKRQGKIGKWGKIRKRKTNRKIRPRRVPTDGDSESGQNSAPSKTKKLVLGIKLGGKVRKKMENGGKSEKGKQQKNLRPNGRQIRNLQVEISLSPNFGAERTFIDPISVTSKFRIF